MPFALRAHALWKSYAAGVAGCSARVWVLRGASLEVEQGECVAVLGARGAGTTTLLHCLAGLRRTDAGTVQLAFSPTLLGAQRDVSSPEVAVDRIVLCDDECTTFGRSMIVSLPTRRGGRGAIIIATHELARVRRIADRVLILREGRLVPINRASGVRRVAEGAIDPAPSPPLSAFAIPSPERRAAQGHR